MPHIHTGENQHDFTATAYIIRVDTSEPRALVHVHKKYGLLLPVGGHIELLETPWQAMAHELAEESGYAFEQLKVLQPPSRLKKISMAVQHPSPLMFNTHNVPTGHFHTDVAYGFVAESDPRLEIGEGESKDLRWLTKAELHDIDKSQVLVNTIEIYDFMFGEALSQWDRIDTSNFLLEYPESYMRK